MHAKYVVLKSPSVATVMATEVDHRFRGAGIGIGNLGFTRAPTTELDIRIETVDVASNSDVVDLAADPEVLSVTPSMPMKLIEPKERDVNATNEAGTTWGVQAVGADTSPFDGSGVTVAVLDSGIDVGHPAFTGVNIVQMDFTGEGAGDANGHGTHCAGTIFGQDVDGLRIGLARNVDKALIGKVLDSSGNGTTEGIASAIQWALDEGANVVSMSLGMDFPGLVERLKDADFPLDLATSIALEAYRGNIELFAALAELARARGGIIGNAALLIAAAGNESKRDQHPDHEIAVAPPAAAAGVVSVGALGQSPQGLTVANFSNTRPEVSGPGVGIRSAKSGGGLTVMSGTSMATPHVAGVAALWASKLLAETGTLTNSGFRARLLGSGHKDVLALPIDHGDIGTGLVAAPQQ